MLQKRSLVIAIALIGSIIGVLAIIFILRNQQPHGTVDMYEMLKSNRMPCVFFYYQNNSQAAFPDESTLFTNLAGAEVQVEDPKGTDSGRYSAENCFLHGTNDSRTITLTVTLPDGFTTTDQRQFLFTVPPSSAFIEMSATLVHKLSIRKLP